MRYVWHLNFYVCPDAILLPVRGRRILSITQQQHVYVCLPLTTTLQTIECLKPRLEGSSNVEGGEFSFPSSWPAAAAADAAPHPVPAYNLPPPSCSAEAEQVESETVAEMKKGSDEPPTEAEHFTKVSNDCTVPVLGPGPGLENPTSFKAAMVKISIIYFVMIPDDYTNTTAMHIDARQVEAPAEWSSTSTGSALLFLFPNCWPAWVVRQTPHRSN